MLYRNRQTGAVVESNIHLEEPEWDRIYFERIIERCEKHTKPNSYGLTLFGKFFGALDLETLELFLEEKTIKVGSLYKFEQELRRELNSFLNELEKEVARCKRDLLSH